MIVVVVVVAVDAVAADAAVGGAGAVVGDGDSSGLLFVSLGRASVANGKMQLREAC